MPNARLTAPALAALSMLGAGTYLRAQPPTAVLRGVVYDSLARTPLAGARIQAAPAGDVQNLRTVTADSLGRFRLDSLAEGRWIVGFDHAVLEPLSLEMPVRLVQLAAGDTSTVTLALPGPRALQRVVCPDHVGDSTAALVGVVRDAESGLPVDGARVFIAWPEVEIGRGRIQQVARRVAVPVRPGGNFLLCGVPAEAELTLRADASGLASGDVVLMGQPGAIARQDLTVGAVSAVAAAAPIDTTALRAAPRLLRGSARLAGTVRDDRGRPIANARVLVLGVEGLGARASDAGTFVIDSLPSGTWTAEARAIGYQPARAVAQLSARSVAETGVVMRKAATDLDRVVVYGKRMSVGERSLYDALDRTRRHGGTLVTPAQIEQQHPLWPSELMRRIPGMSVVRTRFGNMILGRGGCPPAVYVDGMPIQDGARDLDQIVSTTDVMAVEVYRGLVAPVQFGGNSGSRGCGSVIVWTKR